MNKHTYLRGAVTAALCASLTFLVVVQARVGLHPLSLRISAPRLAHGYSSSLTAICSDLEAYWKFDDPTTGVTASDTSENSHAGTLQNKSASSWSTSVSSALGFANTRSLSLDGSTQYVSVPASTALRITGDMTISLWANYDMLSSSASGNVLVSHGATGEDSASNILYQLSLKSTKKLRMQWENGEGDDVAIDSSTAATMAGSSWKHIAVTRSSTDGEVKFYVSGALLGVAQTFLSDPSGGTDGSLFIGRSADATNYFDGKIDDVRMYTAVLTGGQIMALAGGSDAFAGCSCGNEVIESPETCDDGGSNSDATADACRSTCRAASCGDGAVDSGEECDDGASNSDSDADACRSNCVSPVCGDGIVDTGETCDDGNNVNSDACTNACTESSCGDEVIQDGEECDDGDANSDTVSNACRSSCALPACGDSVVDLGEDCDSGSATATCDADCTETVCGDGIANTAAGEECDDGDSNSDSETDACRTDCKSAYCGDAITDTGEDCDDGNSVNTDSCTNTCKSPSCGDGFIQESNNETCEPPNTGTCASNCTGVTGGGGSSKSRSRQRTTTGIVDSQKSDSLLSDEKVEKKAPPPEGCGNRIYEPAKGEECDEGTKNGSSPCSYDCKQLYCGDGVTSPEILEECEPVPVSIKDGIPFFDTPICGLNSCSIPVIDASSGRITGGCKRLFLPACPGETAKQSATTSESAAVCGNGTKEKGEQCDDKNTKDGDGCSSTCKNETCGDGVIQSTESCDNGSVCSTDTTRSCSSDLDCGVTKKCEKNEKDKLTCNGTADGESCESDFDCSFFGKCHYDLAKDTACSKECSVINRCGNGKKDTGEQCDDGNRKDDDGCSKDCVLEEGTVLSCGDGIASEAEECDDGNNTGGDGCSAFCKEERFCGDGQTGDDEECDDGNTEDGDGCSVLCTVEKVQKKAETEQELPSLLATKDNDNAEPKNSPLRMEDRVKQSLCGNRLVEEGEQCDNGLQNSDTMPNACRSDCLLPVCGDGIMDFSEQCDFGTGNTNTVPDRCRMDCTLPRCGDGVLDSGEQCDGGTFCTPSCQFKTQQQAQVQCGNGILEQGEQCDDGNVTGGDGCGPRCFKEPQIKGLAICGNGNREWGEVCDDGNLINGDGCSSVCSREAAKSVTQYPTQVAGETAVVTPQPVVALQQTQTPQVQAQRIVFEQQQKPAAPVQVAPQQPQQPQWQQQAQQNQVPYNYGQVPAMPQQNVAWPYASVIPISSHSTPIGDTGPAALIVVIAGAAGGLSMSKKRRKA
ncbi:hypothetical protein COU78_06670 [Candidatus Peregrinibacteria bacterium CG10_big_fil_rev_8_21_14_0_10_49_24]|nr:MAG: hypothetical protein COV83_01965 [Candidatus Peregrinibacteria bacterium CG11_big_fil_rev_8_21_14_0_20_49_14]PIR50374.1 MAG: hypothetical protein COU78_06670 [Candidatus Peregrinibacteria bacterium CG10_big_fil_rev_8_21_14_0_10_49_24]PJA67463.1 MAG: hypothetical protein CO157_03460 [Candidatus Peregrinibacteria bacterium CG_4_9_14_3_um_filter_49_12]